MKLNLDTLAHLPDGIRRPAYQLGDLTAGIVHIGLGNFHRAHQALYLHRLMNDGAALDRVIIGAGARPTDAAQPLTGHRVTQGFFTPLFATAWPQAGQ